ncbi:hypothetical protein BDQ17DRAFT_1240311 [Cyathus striatus]|nr:hypothetical protein BDQ17DRAFT_1240311 [Cyathus striatus]
MTSYEGLKELYDEQGYVVVEGLVNEKDRAELERACERAIARTRASQWPYRRTVGKQFPPYGDDDPDSWGVQHLMHPDLGEPVFAQWYTSQALIDVVKELLQCNEDELQMELFNLLINPSKHDFALRWHRDDVKENASEAEEREALNKWHYGVQWNTALYTDSCLYIVPGSHKKTRTPEQRALSCEQSPPENPMDMPGAIQVTLKPGQTVFYNSNILHCATYSSHAKRATLHACIGDTRGGSSRARNVLQHGLNWMKGDTFRNTLSTRLAQTSLDRLLRMERENTNVGYSLAG